MARVRAGVEVVIDDAQAKELGYEPAMDAEFATDMEEIVRDRKARDTSAWD